MKVPKYAYYAKLGKATNRENRITRNKVVIWAGTGA